MEPVPLVAATAALNRIKPPPGVIVPSPGEMRNVIERTAGYVARGGVLIEARLRENHANNPKFSFVTDPNDAYRPYYEWRKAEYQAGNVTALAAGRVEPSPDKPPDFAFLERVPPMHAQDLDIVRLTASFAVVHGRAFIEELLQRESGNAQYQFLLPRHSLHAFYQRMVDQYAAIHKDLGADTTPPRVEALQKDADDWLGPLQRAKQRLTYLEWKQAQNTTAQRAKEKVQKELARIDWTRFVVLETIPFGDEDDAAELPPPISLNDLQYASLEDKSKMSLSVARDHLIEEAAPY